MIVAACFGGVHCQAGAQPSGTENDNNNVVKVSVDSCVNKPTVTTYKLYTPTETKDEFIKGCINKLTVTKYKLYTFTESQGTNNADNNGPKIFSSHENILPSGEASGGTAEGSSGEGQMSNDKGANLTWLWILIGIIAGVIVLGGIVFFVVKK
ncbi:hypothetical protein DSO57_1034841 [Entomophthora muscae]|uniref:Uncharacterized protein n=1 Tax=Entomophthora muscae TaxID=34485 RepID=A0ACC2SZZ7_9FUNG|nr:hypothetical protein DSO57_1034841 [Entomophthora muscae]